MFWITALSEVILKSLFDKDSTPFFSNWQVLFKTLKFSFWTLHWSFKKANAGGLSQVREGFLWTWCLFFVVKHKLVVFDHRSPLLNDSGLKFNYICTSLVWEALASISCSIHRWGSDGKRLGLRENEGQTMRSVLLLPGWWCANPCHRHPIYMYTCN